MQVLHSHVNSTFTILMRILSWYTWSCWSIRSVSQVPSRFMVAVYHCCNAHKHSVLQQHTHTHPHPQTNPCKRLDCLDTQTYPLTLHTHAQMQSHYSTHDCTCMLPLRYIHIYTHPHTHISHTQHMQRHIYRHTHKIYRMHTNIDTVTPSLSTRLVRQFKINLQRQQYDHLQKST